MLEILIVGIGGFIGSAMRYTIGLTIKTPEISGVPYKIILVNLIGCFLIGLFANAINEEKEIARLLLITGILGGFTTYSSFGLEAVNLILSQNYINAFTYISISLVGGLISVCVGIYVGRIL